MDANGKHGILYLKCKERDRFHFDMFYRMFTFRALFMLLARFYSRFYRQLVLLLFSLHIEARDKNDGT